MATPQPPHDPEHPIALQVKRDLKRKGVAKAQLQRTPSELAWDTLEQDYWGARGSLSPGRKADYMRFFNRDFAPRLTRSGNSLRPVSRFHSSNVSGVISPLTRSSANLRR